MLGRHITNGIVYVIILTISEIHPALSSPGDDTTQAPLISPMSGNSSWSLGLKHNTTFHPFVGPRYDMANTGQQETDLGMQEDSSQKDQKCPRCIHGTCDETGDTITVTSDYDVPIGVPKCHCDIGYNGNFCDEDYQGCLNNRCPYGHSCQDIPANEQTDNVNTYICSKDCMNGFTSVDSMCQDINECVTGRHNCEQVCHNTEGSHTCLCEYGLQLQPDNLTCWGPHTIDSKCSVLCQVAAPAKNPCRNRHEICHCGIGWMGVDCSMDVDECGVTPSVCPKGLACHNLPGSYRCDCPAGYKWDEGDTTCKECEKWKFDTDCSQTCRCNETNTVSCNNVHGRCNCRTGWTGKDCSVSVCWNPREVCPEFSRCIETIDGYRCECYDGYLWNNLTATCTECNNGTLESECGEVCLCNETGTLYCSKTDRKCVCQTGWTGQDCSIRDCCSTHTCPEAATCVNTMGDCSCRCPDGYTLQDAACFELATLSLKITLSYNVSGVDLKNVNSPGYKQLADEVEKQMSHVLTVAMDVPVFVVVTMLRQGSLVVDAEVTFVKSNYLEPETALAYGILNVTDSGGFKLADIQSPVSAVKTEHYSFRANDSKCQRKRELDPCQDNSECHEEDGLAVCRYSTAENEGDWKIVIIAVISSLFFVLLISVVGYCWLRSRCAPCSKKVMDPSLTVSTDSFRDNFCLQPAQQFDNISNTTYFSFDNMIPSDQNPNLSGRRFSRALVVDERGAMSDASRDASLPSPELAECSLNGSPMSESADTAFNY